MPETATARPLTRTQCLILRFVRDFTARHGFCPTMREIGDATGLTATSSVSYQLGLLEARGMIRRDSSGSRSTPRRIIVTGPARVTVDPADLRLVLGADVADATAAQKAAAHRLWQALGEQQI